MRKLSSFTRKEILIFTACCYAGGLLMGYKPLGLEIFFWVGVCYAFSGFLLGLAKIFGFGQPVSVEIEIMDAAGNSHRRIVTVSWPD
jgi:hypothetical protein